MADDSTKPRGYGNYAPIQEHFYLECNAGKAGSLKVHTEQLSLVVSQRVRMAGDVQFWHSVQIQSLVDSDGTLSIKVCIWDPKLEEALQIALLKSRPDDPTNGNSLDIDLKHTLSR